MNKTDEQKYVELIERSEKRIDRTNEMINSMTMISGRCVEHITELTKALNKALDDLSKAQENCLAWRAQAEKTNDLLSIVMKKYDLLVEQVMRSHTPTPAENNINIHKS